MRSFWFFVFILLSFPCLAQEKCNVEISELSPGVSEVVFPDMRIKLESGSGIFKLKLVGIPGVIEDWTSAKISSDGEPSQISGFVEKDGAKYFFAQVIVKRTSDSVEWAIYRSEKLSQIGAEGKAYFQSKGEIRCARTNVQKWISARKAIFGEKFVDSSGVVVPYRTEL